MEPKVAAFIDPGYSSCAYLLVAPRAGGAAVIDPGESAARSIIEMLPAQGTRLSYVLLTHEHFDHIAGVNDIRKIPGVRLICSEECAQRIGDPKLNFSHYLTRVDYRCDPPDETYEGLGWSFEFGGLALTFLKTPGHSPGSCCISVGSSLFTGDTLIRDYRTVTKLPGGDKRALEKSLEMIGSRFGPGTTVYPGHGESFRLGDLSAAAAGRQRN